MTVLVVQGRLDSKRLPGKTMLPLEGEPLIFRVMEALNRVPCDARVLACPEDCVSTFRPLAARAGFELVSGPKEDVLARYCLALRRFPGADLCIRATADNPFVFADAAAALAARALEAGADYAGYQELPLGAGVEAVRVSALFRAEQEARETFEREHVCPYLYGHGEIFRLLRPPAPAPWNASGIRLTVDTEEDYRRAQSLYAALGGCFGHEDSRYNGKNIITTFNGLFNASNETLNKINESFS